jgi:hypothetical protein
VLATGSDSILEFYLRAEGIDPQPLLYSGRLGRRVVIIVNSLGGQTLHGLRRQAALMAGWTAPKPVASYPSAALFVVERR